MQGSGHKCVEVRGSEQKYVEVRRCAWKFPYLLVQSKHLIANNRHFDSTLIAFFLVQFRGGVKMLS